MSRSASHFNCARARWYPGNCFNLRLKIPLGLAVFLALFPGLMSLAHAQEEQWRSLRDQFEERFQQGRDDEALAAAEAALTIAEDTFGALHPNVARSLEALARVHAAQGHFTLAEPLYQRALTISQAVFKRDHPEILYLLDALADIYQAQGTYAAAEDLSRQALALRELGLVRSLSQLGHLQRQQGRYDEAEPLFQRGLTIMQTAVGRDDPDVAFALMDLADLYVDQSRYAEAEPLYQRALTIRQQALGPDHPLLEWSLTGLAGLYQAQGKFAQAEPLYQRALIMVEALYGEDRPECVRPLVHLAALYRDQGQPARAEALYRHALHIVRATLGADHLAAARPLIGLAKLQQSRARYGEAIALYEKSLALRERALGLQHPDVAQVLHDLAQLYVIQGRYSAAESLYTRAVHIQESTFSPHHPEVAHVLGGLAKAYLEQGKYAESELTYARSLAIVETAYGPEHREVARMLIGMAELHARQGDYTTARRLSERILTTAERFLTGADRQWSTLIADLLTIIRNDSALTPDEDIESALKRIIALVEAMESEHPLAAPWLKTLADVYRLRGDFQTAEALYRRALAMLETHLGEAHPDVALLLNKMGALEAARGNEIAATAFYRRALTLAESALGSEHPVVADFLADLAVMEIVQERPKEALLLLQRALAIDEQTLNNVFSVVSERRKFAFLSTVNSRYALLLNLVVQKLPTDADAMRTAMSAVLRWKGAVLEALIRERRVLATSDDPTTAEAVGRLQAIASRLAQLVWADPAYVKVDEYRRQLASLEAEKERLEGQLAYRGDRPAPLQRGRPVPIDQVAKALTPGSALIEYVVFQTVDFQARGVQLAWQTYRYLAFVLPAGPQAQPQLINLGEADIIDGITRTLRRQMKQAPELIVRMGEEAAEQRFRKAATRFYQAVFAPLIPALHGRTVLYAVPDGSLNSIPFEVAQDEQGRYLIETYSIDYLSSGRDALAQMIRPASSAAVVVFADPDYDAIGDLLDLATAATPGAHEQGPEDLAHGQGKSLGWGALPGTRHEAAMLVDVFGQGVVQQYLGRQAREDVFKQLKAPRILHVATHGFFVDASESPTWRLAIHPGADVQDVSTAATWHLQAESFHNPSLRSGLVLAGANLFGRPSSAINADDGIMTGLEIAGLNLWGTELIVLSACETGVGEFSQGEGVFGLHRAFQLAGARTVIMSLWAIPDRETVDIMADFYRRLRAGRKTAQALRDAALAQLWARRVEQGVAHPFFWGAFVTFGSSG